MLLRSPAEVFIKCLLVHPDKHDTGVIKGTLDIAGLDFVSIDYIEGLRRALRPPTPFFPFNQTHTRSYRFLASEKLTHFFFPDGPMLEARKLLGAPRAKEFVETMLLTHAPLAAIANAVATYKHFPISVAGIERYRYYFWNVDLLDTVAMKTLLQLRYERLSLVDTNDGKILARAAKKASYQDPRKVAADLPFSPLAAMLVQMRLGMMPAKIDVAKRMESARNLAAVRAEECLHYATPGDASRAFNYAMTAKILHEMLETLQRADDTLREELSAIALRTDARPLPSIHQLSAGRHTVDMQPQPHPDAHEPLSEPHPSHQP